MRFHKTTIRVYIKPHVTNVIIIFLDNIHQLQLYIDDLKCTFLLKNLKASYFKYITCSLKLYKSKSLCNLLQKLSVNSVKS